MTLSRAEVRATLEEYQLDPSRALGQNFLCDRHMVDKIVRLAEVTEGDRVVEVGPGLGTLTAGLCQAGARVTAIEIDRYLIDPLRAHVGQYENDGVLRIINDDVLKVDWSEILGPVEDGTWSVIANLPYNIATPLILDLLASEPRLDSWVVMVQREAGERLVATPGSKIYGIPSVLLAYWAQARLAVPVPPDLFHPRPNVDSVLVTIKRHADPDADLAPFGRFSHLVRTGFGKRRKMLRRSLVNEVSPEQFEQAGIESTRRPEELSVSEWSQLATVAP